LQPKAAQIFLMIKKGGSMEKKYQRKTYYIKNSAQSKFIFRFVSISILGGILAVSGFNFLAYKKIDAVLYSMRFPKISASGLLWNEMIYTNIFVIVFIILVFFITARALYNKVHGPLKKLTNDFKRIEDGDLTLDIALRENDEFRDFASDLDGLVKNFNKSFSEINELNKSIIKTCEKNSGETTDDSVVSDLKSSVSKLKTIIGSFQV